MNSQTRGLAEAVGVPYTMMDTRIAMPWTLLPPGWCPRSLSVVSGPPGLKSGPPPGLVISCGRHGIVPSLALKRKFGNRVFTVHIQDPKMPGKHFDLVVAPEHDAVAGENVYRTTGALHYVTPERLAVARESAEAAAIGAGGQGIVAVLVGGRNGYYRFAESEAEVLVAALKATAAENNVRLVVVSSNRTEPGVIERMRQALGREHYVWDGVSPNPYFAALSRADYIVVTGDSVSMVSEAAATGQPVFVHHLPKRRPAPRFEHFHAQFERAGITRPFTGSLARWRYEAPNDTPHIAALIRERIGLG